jgi:hypothetical protein
MKIEDKKRVLREMVLHRRLKSAAIRPISNARSAASSTSIPARKPAATA